MMIATAAAAPAAAPGANRPPDAIAARWFRCHREDFIGPDFDDGFRAAVSLAEGRCSDRLPSSSVPRKE